MYTRRLNNLVRSTFGERGHIDIITFKKDWENTLYIFSEHPVRLTSVLAHPVYSHNQEFSIDLSSTFLRQLEAEILQMYKRLLAKPVLFIFTFRLKNTLKNEKVSRSFIDFRRPKDA